MKKIIIIALCALALCAKAEDKTLVDLYIGGFFGSRIHVNIRGDQCLYRMSSGDESDLQWKSTTIKADDLSAFMKTCDDLGAFTWDREYVDKNVADGTQWSVRIRGNGKQVSSRGDNAFPQSFAQFQSAVVKLVGQKFQ